MSVTFAAGASGVAKPADEAGARAANTQMVLALCAFLVAILSVVAYGRGFATETVQLIWLANGFAAGAWLRGARTRAFDALYAGMMAVGLAAAALLAGFAPTTVAAMTVANLVEIVLVVAGFRLFVPRSERGSVRWTMKFIAVALVAAPALGALVYSGIRSALGAQFDVTLTASWFAAHALGMLALMPLVLLANREALQVFSNPRRLAEWVVLIGGFAGAIIFSRMTVAHSAFGIENILLVLIAVRLRVSGLCVAALLAALFASQMALVGPAAVEPDRLAIFAVNSALRLVTAFAMMHYVAAMLFERDELSRQAERARQAAERASEAKSRLLANVAHEIKSPIGGVIGIADMWAGGALGPVTPQQKEMADMLVGAARQVHTLSLDLLDVAKAEAGEVPLEMRPTDVHGLLEDVARMTRIRPDAAGFEVKVQSAPGIVAMADSQRMMQVLSNLATNAVKYAAAGNELTLRADRMGRFVRIEIIDKGPGITPAKQAELFEPFNRLGMERSTVEGHGIGLALARRLVEVQGGAMGVESEPGQGATFWIQLDAA